MGLRRIALRDFVIVSALELDLDAGFTVLTGETGAGKSILVDALQLATGARADTRWIREGAQRAEVSVEFDLPDALTQQLTDCGFEGAETLLLRRTVDAQGRSRAWVNGSAATVQQLRDLGEQLLDIHGQHAWQSLTRPEAVRGLLDAYARLGTDALNSLWHNWKQCQQQLQDALQAQESLQREHDRLTWQIDELDKLAPKPHEWETLNAQHGRLSNGQALMDAAQAALAALHEDSANGLRQLHFARQQLHSQLRLEPGFASPIGVLDSSIAEVEDVVHSLRAYLRSVDLDPAGLAELDQRMQQWISLARKFRRAPQDLADQLLSWKNERQALEAAADIERLQQSEREASEAYLKEATRLSKARSEAALRLATSITDAMQGLGMSGGQFQVQVQRSAQPQSHGIDEVTFLVAGHAGSTPRPVAKVASGGELSRIALAIAVTTSQLGTAQTLVFDEVDAGVGGAVAQTVGRLMQQLGRDRQVLAVTHLPQVAACANHHLVVAKRFADGATLSSVEPVRDAGRVAELARMLGGDKGSETSVAHAIELMQSGR